VKVTIVPVFRRRKAAPQGAAVPTPLSQSLRHDAMVAIARGADMNRLAIQLADVPEARILARKSKHTHAELEETARAMRELADHLDQFVRASNNAHGLETPRPIAPAPPQDPWNPNVGWSTIVVAIVLIVGFVAFKLDLW
jgi:hypothetical protein